MLSVLPKPSRRTGAAASLLLLVLTLVFLILQHAALAAEVGEAKPTVIFTDKVHSPAPSSPKAGPDQKGPGGSQPWVAWSYII